MIFRITLFIVYLFSFLFNKLYFNIFKILKRYIFKLPKSYNTYSIKKKINYLGYLFILCMLIFCKIFLFTYYYILIFYNILVKIYIDIILKKKYKKFLDLLFGIYWYNLLVHLKVLNIKFQNPIDLDIVYYTLKWNSCYYYYFIIYIFKDLVNLLIWSKFQWNILYLQVMFYFKNRKLECIYYYQLFTKGFLDIYCFSGIKSFIKNPIKWKKITYKKKNNVSLISKLKFTYHRNNRIIKEKFYRDIKQPMYIFSYFINNLIESIFFVLFKTGANSIIYYFYKIIKYSYSICVYLWKYLWKSDIIYRFFKLIERKKW